MAHPFAEIHHVDLSFAALDLSGETVQSREFVDCRFVSCRFPETVFDDCRFVNCSFKGCDLSLTRLPNSAFSGITFEDCRLVGINWAAAGWRKGQLLEPVRFQQCTLNHCTFIGLSLPALKLVDCSARNVDFREADLARADFSGTDLTDSLFQHTNLAGANLSTARNYAIAPEHNSLKRARFSLPEAMSLLYNMEIELVE